MNKKRKIIIGNWKMNKTITESVEYFYRFAKSTDGIDNIDFGIAPNFLSIRELIKNYPDFLIYSQNCNDHESGAYTGEVSVEMLKDVGVNNCIIGHSERREYYNETNESVNKKLILLLKNNFNVILCVGETLDEYNSNKTTEKIYRQLEEGLKNVAVNDFKRIVIAYEPIWAIGTGKTATTEIASAVCKKISSFINDKFGEKAELYSRIIYGGSVDLNNILPLLTSPYINGALVGGKSLNSEIFSNMIKAVSKNEIS